MDYRTVPAADVPGNIIWHTPGRNQGQIVEVSYSRGIPAGKAADMEADEGAPWKRVKDTSVPETIYYKLFS